MTILHSFLFLHNFVFSSWPLAQWVASLNYIQVLFLSNRTSKQLALMAISSIVTFTIYLLLINCAETVWDKNLSVDFPDCTRGKFEFVPKIVKVRVTRIYTRFSLSCTMKYQKFQCPKSYSSNVDYTQNCYNNKHTSHTTAQRRNGGMRLGRIYTRYAPCEHHQLKPVLVCYSSGIEAIALLRFSCDYLISASIFSYAFRPLHTFTGWMEDERRSAYTERKKN